MVLALIDPEDPNEVPPNVLRRFLTCREPTDQDLRDFENCRKILVSNFKPSEGLPSSLTGGSRQGKLFAPFEMLRAPCCDLKRVKLTRSDGSEVLSCLKRGYCSSLPTLVPLSELHDSSLWLPENPTKVRFGHSLSFRKAENIPKGKQHSMLKRRNGEAKLPVADVSTIASNTKYLMDTGASLHTLPSDVDFEKYLREYRKKWDVSTANGSIPTVEGARASLSPAFDDADHAYIENGPAMRAVGLDCEKADGKTFIWVAGRVPCYVDRRRGVITIFDKEHHNPVYGPWFEWDDKLH